MGGTRYDPSAYSAYAGATASMRDTDYKARTMPKAMDPKQIKVRESVRSDVNPRPTPIIVGLDVTGSMGRVVEQMRKGLGTLFSEILNRNPVSDPHVLAMGIGDMDYDSAPAQATQFEGDPVTIGKQVEDLYLERGGGNNDHESYLGPLYFAVNRTKCDAFDDGRKGYLFTIGDEEPQDVLTEEQILRFFGDQPKADISAEDMLREAEKNWHVFHIMVAEGSHATHHADRVRRKWAELMGQKAIWLKDHTKLSEVIISIIEVTNGRDVDSVAKSWDGTTGVIVRDAIAGLPTTGAGSPVAL